jgi:malate dehydrogenase (oxaloacetate-decarboxylating)(NADP+)
MSTSHNRTSKPAHDRLQGVALLDDPIHNEYTTFTLAERRDCRPEGLLPHAFETLDRQVERVMQQLEAQTD